jgi:hypothetical protein
MSMVSCFLVVAGFVVFGGLCVMPRGMTMLGWCGDPQLSSI